MDENDSRDDLGLVQRVASGDEDALESFFKRYADPLFAFIYHHLDESQQDAEELWQVTLSAAIRSLSTYRGQSSLFTWLCCIARHKIADHYRQRKLPLDVFSDVPDVQLRALISSDPLPEEYLLQRATRIQVVKALAALPEKYRSALVARYVEDRSVMEISQMLNKTYKGAESLLSRARSAFRETLLHLEEERDE